MKLEETYNKLASLLGDRYILNEAKDEEMIFETPMDIFKWIVKEHQYLYVKKNEDGKFQGTTDKKSKKGWILVDAQTANYAIKIYDATTEENKKKLDIVSLEKFLAVVSKIMSR